MEATVTETIIPLRMSSSELRQLALEYNWDDGFEVPQHIADHQSCDLAVALELFWLSEAASVYLGEASEHPYNTAWRTFSRNLADRILSGHYTYGSASFMPPLTKVQIYKYRKKGLPEVFLSSVSGVQA